MTFHVLVDDHAWNDYQEIQAYFTEQLLLDLIPRFEEDLLATLQFIGEHPTLRREVRSGVRHEQLRVFPYHVWFRVFEDIEHVEAFAILHRARGSHALEGRL